MTPVLSSPWLTRAARAVAWSSLALCYVGLHARYLARRISGIDPRVHDSAGELPGLSWWVREYAPSGERQRYRVWLGIGLVIHERWVNEATDAYAWVVLAAREPAWCVLTEDGDEPWTMVRALEVGEVRDVLERTGCRYDVVEQVTAQVAGRWGL